MSDLTSSQEPDTFRRLVEGEIGVDEYVKSLDDRVREAAEPARRTDRSVPPEREDSGA